MLFTFFEKIFSNFLEEEMASFILKYSWSLDNVWNIKYYLSHQENNFLSKFSYLCAFQNLRLMSFTSPRNFICIKG